MHNQVRKFSKSFLKRSTADTVTAETGLRTRIHPATANAATTTHVRPSRLKRTGSSTTRNTTASASRKAATSKNTGRTSFSASTTPARTSLSKTFNRSERCTNTTNGGCTSSAASKSTLRTHRATVWQALISGSAISPPSPTATTPYCTPVARSRKTNTTSPRNALRRTIRPHVRRSVSIASEQVVGRTSCTHCRKTSFRSASNVASERLSWATSAASARTRTVTPATGDATAISICMGGRSTASRRCSRIRPRLKASRSSRCPNEGRRRRVRRAGGRISVSALNAGCTSASADSSGTPTVMAQRTSDEKYSRILHRRIGITAGWHSQRSACSTVARALSPRENRSWTANHTIPTAVGNPRRLRRAGCHLP